MTPDRVEIQKQIDDTLKSKISDLAKLRSEFDTLKKFSMMRSGLDPTMQMGLDSSISVWPQSKIPRPQVIVHRSSNQTITNVLDTIITWNADDYNPTVGMHVVGTNPSRLTVPVSGVYLIQSGIDFAISGGGAIRFAKIIANGNAANELARVNGFPNAATPAAQIVSKVHFLNSLDYVEISVYQDSGGNLDVLGGTGVSTSWASLTQLL